MTSFYQRSLEERVALTETAIREKRTLVERWSVLETAEASPWNARAAMAAELLRDQPSVADFGCGTMLLSQYLRPDQHYVPLDVVARDDRTLVCDLNVEPPPETGAEAAAFLGVLEYLHDPAAVLRDLVGHYQVIAVTYCIIDAPSPQWNRRQHAWVNDFSEADLLFLFRQSGWTPDAGRMVDGLQKLWRLSAAAPRSN